MVLRRSHAVFVLASERLRPGFVQAVVMGERLCAEAKVTRDRGIVLDRGRGLTWCTIAHRHGLTERQCRNVWAQRSTAGAELGERDPVEERRDLLDELDAAGEACALLIESTRNDSVKVAAIKARLTVLGQRFGLLHACGLLPRNLGRLGAELDLRQLESAILTVLEDHNFSREAAEDRVAALDPSRLQPRTGGNGLPVDQEEAGLPA